VQGLHVGDRGKGVTPKILDRLERTPVVGIVRGISDAAVAGLADACIGAGIEWIEITLNTPSALEKIGRLSDLAGDRLVVGAGTVLDAEALDAALAAGARFIVSPILDREVVTRCAEIGVPVFPGALTPQEVFDAWRAGATMVKVFPAQFFGPDYLRELRGPFDRVPLLACGGVRADNVAAYFAAGANAVAIGGGTFKRAWIEQARFDLLQAEIAQVVSSARAAAALAKS
jgi:2-dehydro-3-deoxyphosphogluconate aldolase/(4S)-4-hydroxy-2-oxoglutarate aldolase